MKLRRIVFGSATVLSLGACAESPTDSPDDFGYEGTGIEFQIAPLTLDSLADACYSFAIQNGEEQLVVGRGPEAQIAFPTQIDVSSDAARSVCASQFGNSGGGDISYVAPCDADTVPDGNALHTVSLWVDALCAAPLNNDPPSPGAVGDSLCDQIQAYVDPCPTGCKLDVTCVENADTPVSFNFTIMGQADQGFFDIAVNFDDVFCSAKADTCGTTGDPLKLVFDPVTGARMDTLVVAVACTAGNGDGVDTHLTHSSLSLDCGATGGVFNTGGVVAEGNQTDVGGVRWAAYFGTEALPGVNKVYSNFAFGLAPESACNLSFQVVPSNGTWANPSGSNTYNSYGLIDFKIAGIGPGTAGCTTMPLNGGPGASRVNGGSPGEGDGVKTVYNTGDFAAVTQIGEGDTSIGTWSAP
jgi:hypothetical protein